MSDNEIDYNAETFDIGRVINRTFATVKRNFVGMFAVAGLIVGIPAFLVNFLPMFFVNGDIESLLGDMEANSGEMFGLVGAVTAVSVIAGLVILVATVVLQGAITHASVKDFNGEPVDLRESLRVGLRYFWPLVGFALLSALGMALGLVLFIIPGIIFALMWMVGAPAIVIENTGVSGAFDRSSALTSGSKWWLLLLAIIYYVISIIVAAIGQVFLIPLGINEAFSPMMQNLAAPVALVYSVIQAIIQTMTTIIATVGIASTYYELRYIKEGIGVEALASVFD